MSSIYSFQGGSDEAPERPVLRWHGGKWLLASWIIGDFPTHGRWYLNSSDLAIMEKKMSDGIGWFARELSTGVSLLAALVGWRAAFLWFEASKIDIPEFDSPPASVDPDGHELYALSVVVQFNGTADALKQAGKLNMSAAKWTALAAFLSGGAALLGVL